MKKTVNFKGEKIQIEFQKTVNSGVHFKERIEKELISVVGYDYVINNTIFKIVARTIGYKRRTGLYAGSIEGRTKLSVPGVLQKEFENVDKKVIEALINKFPSLLDK